MLLFFVDIKSCLYLPCLTQDLSSCCKWRGPGFSCWRQHNNTSTSWL